MGEPGEGLYDELQTTLAAIDVPVMLARGMRPDSVLRDEDEAALLEVLPAAQVEHFDQAGHSIKGDMPVELAAPIQPFIHTLGPAPIEGMLVAPRGRKRHA